VAKKKQQSKRREVDWDILEQIQVDAAGIDIGAEEIYVCVPPRVEGERVRVFSTFTSDLERLVDWLEACGVKTVAMESTGVYWIPLFDLLEQRGLEVCLVNTRHLKNVSGRKSDMVDCEWLYQLHSYGLLRGSFHPPEAIRPLRALGRQRAMLLSYRAAHIQHMQKALDLMNLKLTMVLSDITGLTGMKIIRAILAGERNPASLAAMRDPKCKRSGEEIAQALTGTWRREHLFTLQQAVELYDTYTGQIEKVDAEMERLYAQLEESPIDEEQNTTPPSPDKLRRSKNQPHFDLAGALYRMAGVDLTQIDGIDAATAQVILTNVGWDVSKWPTAGHFASWLGLCPNNKVSGGKVKGRHTRKTDNRVASALRLSAQSLARSDSALGAFYRRIKARHGASVANVATAHKLARIIYHMLKHRLDYHDPGASHYDAQQRQRMVKRLQKQAAQLGLRLEVAPVPPTEPTFVS
jgi:transposase